MRRICVRGVLKAWKIIPSISEAMLEVGFVAAYAALCSRCFQTISNVLMIAMALSWMSTRQSARLSWRLVEAVRGEN